MTPDPKDQGPHLRLPLAIHFEGPGVARQRLELREFLLFGREIQIALDRVARALQGQLAASAVKDVAVSWWG